MALRKQQDIFHGQRNQKQIYVSIRKEYYCNILWSFSMLDLIKMDL